jgi:hypothetical protein
MKIKIGDLVRVQEPRACGGLRPGAVGLVLDEDKHQPGTPRWTVHWLHGNSIDDTGMIMKESVTYGYGLEVIGSVA